jgi:cytochrome c-type biogenesis protein CcmH
MKASTFVLLLSMFISSIAYAIDNEVAFADPALLARYQHLINELRCPKCQNETIGDSDAPIAADLRREIRDLLAAGKTDDEVIKFLTDRYGDFVLYNPPFVARTWLLWAAPGLALLGGFSIAVAIIRRRARMPFEDDAAPHTEGTPSP